MSVLESAGFFITGGTVPLAAASYVERRADRELLAALLAGEYCFLLNARQMGKSSLSVRTIAHLKEQGVRTIFLDLTKVGGINATAEQWYAGMLSEAGRQIEMRKEFLAFWRANTELPAVQRLFAALEIALDSPEPIVVFVDEVDAVRSLPFSTDEFFAAIRAFYNERAQYPKYQRIAFCLVGSATPADLIADVRTSPFNIARYIELNDFTPAEVAPLAKGLGTKGQALLDRVYYWTNGHPYLTQTLCAAIVEKSIDTPTGVDALVAETFLDVRARTRNINLADVANRLLRPANTNGTTEETDEHKAAVLGLYEHVWRGRPAVKDDETDSRIALLKLSGVTRIVNGLLKVRCRIYERVFDRTWIVENLPGAEIRRQKAAFRRGLLQAFVLSGVCAIVFAALLIMAVKNARVAKANERQAIAATQRANENEVRATKEAERATLEAEKAKREAQHAQIEAANAKHSAEAERRATLVAKQAVITAKQAAQNEKSQRHMAEMATLSATEATGREHAQLAIARRETERARAAGYIAYQANISAAARALDAGDTVTAQNLLIAYKNEPRRGIEYRWLWQKAHREKRTLYGHNSNAVTLAFLANGNLATGSDYLGQIWDKQTGKPISRLISGTKCFWKIAALHEKNSTLLVAGGEDKLALWDSSTGKRVRAYEGLTGKVVNVVKMSPEDKTIYVGCDDGMVHRFETFTGKKLPDFVPKPISGGEVSINSLAVSPDGSRIAGVASAQISVWDSTGKLLHSFGKQQGRVRTIAFSPDGKTIASGSEDHTVYLWDAETGTPQLPDPIRCSNLVSTVIFSPNGKLLCVGNGNGQLYTCDAHTGATLTQISAHASNIHQAVFSPDSSQLATVGEDNKVKLWDTTTIDKPLGKRLPLNEKLEMAETAFSPTGTQMAVAQWESTQIQRYDMTTGKFCGTLTGHTRGVFCVTYSPDGTLIASGSVDRTVRLWDVKTGELRRTIRDLPDAVYDVAFSPDGKQLAACWQNNQIWTWDVKTGERLLALKLGPATARFNSIAYFPSLPLRFVAVTSEGCWTYDCTTNRTIAVYKAPGSARVTFAPDGKTALSGCGDGTVRRFDPLTGREIFVYQGQPGKSLGYVSVSPDGQRVLASGFNEWATLWAADNGRELMTLPTHHMAYFFPDGNTILRNERITEQAAVHLDKLPTLEEIQQQIVSDEASQRSGAVVLTQCKGAIEQARLAAARQLAQQLNAERVQRNAEMRNVKNHLPRREATMTAAQIDLSPFYNGELTAAWSAPGLQGPTTLSAFPTTGYRSPAGTLFDGRGVVQLFGIYLQTPCTYPRDVGPIPVQQKVEELHFLGATAYNDEPGRVIAKIQVLYNDGKAAEVPLHYGREVQDWWQWTKNDAPLVAWTGKNPANPVLGGEVHLYEFVWQNPRPNVSIKEMYFHSTGANAAPFLVAVTAVTTKEDH